MHAVVANPGHKLISGMFAEIKIVVEEHKGVIVVDKNAVIHKDGTDYVYVIEDGHAKLRKVTVGISEDEKTEITEGVSSEDHIVIRGKETLSDGMLVEEKILESAGR
jgi:HlyD family secretion protein